MLRLICLKCAIIVIALFHVMFKKYFLLLLILLLALFLRFWQLGEIPSGIHMDEADTGYSAYSILKTGLSQYGTFNLLALEES